MAPFAAEEGSLLAGLGLGLAIMMWNYSGWDAPTTTLGETRDPGPSFRRAVWVALPLITLAYVLPVAASLSAVDGWEDWDTGHWPVVAEAIGGPWLANLVAVGAVIATAGLFLSLLLTNSRLPYVLALAGQMPAALGRLHPRFGTPWGAVVLSSVALQPLRVLELQGADRAQYLAVLDHARPGAGRLRGPAPPRAGAAAAVARGRRQGGDVAGGGAAVALLPARDGDRGVARIPRSASPRR